jgi:Methyltransferase domain
LSEAIAELRPKIIVEVGVWKGMSTLHMAQTVKALELDCAIIAVDTWLGSAEHWLGASLPRKGGYPTAYFTFMANVLAHKQQDVVVPMPLDSVNAASVMQYLKVASDIIHLDAGHDYCSTRCDLVAWWPVLRGGGILIEDDYYTDGSWPGTHADVLAGAALLVSANGARHAVEHRPLREQQDLSIRNTLVGDDPA